MKKLLLDTENSFDDFLLSEAVIKMAVTFTIDGHFNKDFFDCNGISDVYPGIERKMSYWKELKANVFSVIKGKKVPSGFNIVLYKTRNGINLMLRLSYDGSKLTALTGTVYNEFTLNKSADRIWDEEIIQFFTQCEIPFELQ